MTAAASPWAWHAHPDVWAVMSAIGLAYVVALTRRGAGSPDGQPVATRRQLTLFAVGFAFLWLASDWPIHDLGERYLLSAHMVQHLMFTFLVPPLLLLAVPPWLMVRLMGSTFPGGLLRKLTRPFAAAVLFNAVVAVSHYPGLVNASLRSEPVHFTVHALLFTTALLMWFPVMNRLPEFPRLGDPGRMIYLFLQSVIPTVPSAFLTFGDGVLYKFYAHVPRIWGISALEDQQMAGAIMKVIGGGGLWAVIVVMFFRWYARSERGQGDVLTWDDVERELKKTPAPH